jgi:O-acetylhomoserine/O-acetylserine sulfhydrylase-like pyridoxal-dependent enzyme
LLICRRSWPRLKKINRTRSESDRIITIVDNTFATPWALRPIEWGLDIVIHSLTKNIGGFGTEMGGAAMGAKKFERGLKLARKDFRRDLSIQSQRGELPFKEFPRLRFDLKNSKRMLSLLQSISSAMRK